MLLRHLTDVKDTKPRACEGLGVTDVFETGTKQGRFENHWAEDDMNVGVDYCIFKASSDAVSSPMGEELALLDFRTNTYFTLNETGADIWAFLSEPQSIEAICLHISQLYEVNPDMCRDDVVRLVSDLEAAGLVDRTDDPTR